MGFVSTISYWLCGTQHFSVHLIPWILGACSTVPLVCGYRSDQPRYTKIGAGLFATALLLAWVFRRILPINVVFERYKANDAANSNHVGIRDIKGGSQAASPSLLVYYPTNVKPDPKMLPKWLPDDGNEKFVSGVAAYSSTPMAAFAHTATYTVEATTNAAVNASSIGTKKNPIILFSHGLSGLKSMHACMALDLAAKGAIVVSVEHTDGSASYAVDCSPTTTKRAPTVPHHTVEATEDCIHVPMYIGTVEDIKVRGPQLEHRQEDVRRAVQFIAGGGLAKALQMSPEASADLAARCRDNSVALYLSGHSFGGATMALTAVNHAAQRQPLAVRPKQLFLFDWWHWPMEKLDIIPSLELIMKSPSMSSALPTINLFDSEYWMRWEEYNTFMKKLLPVTNTTNSSPKIVWRDAKGTDHITCTDMGVVLNYVARKKFHRKFGDRHQIYKWTEDVWRSIQEGDS